MAFPLKRLFDFSFDEGIENLKERDPVVASSAEELRQKYTEENIFGALWVPSFDAIMASMQKKIASGLEEGLSSHEIEKSIKEEIPSLSSAYTENVFRTNVNTAYTEGRIAEAKRMSDFVMGFEFSPVGDADTRPEHEALRGLIAATDDHVWNILKTPLDYNCRCMLITITRPQVEEDNPEAIDEIGALRRYHPELGFDFTTGQLLDFLRANHPMGDLPTFVKDRA